MRTILDKLTTLKWRSSFWSLSLAIFLICGFILDTSCAEQPRTALPPEKSWRGSGALDLNIEMQGQQLQPPQRTLSSEATPNAILGDLLDAVHVMQTHFFAVWKGTWPLAIDWTAAVMGTQLSAALGAIASSETYVPRDSPFGIVSANTIDGYFAHLSAFYFGENDFALRTQANDDMLWVVLDWLEAIKFVNAYSDKHFPGDADAESSWHGKHFISAFAHRARVFWDLASNGWDTTLCGGGMIWSPYLTPYKNAITNELYISASISMYLYFPGDDNDFPFVDEPPRPEPTLPKIKPHDRKYLDAAVEAYNWLNGSHMRNSQGLYVDGFHITGWRGGRDGSNGTGKCDERENSVYTYNQGVILSGQRGLWEATGKVEYLTEGHALIRAVISATGFHVADPQEQSKWAGLGRRGVLEERCDASGRCSQNGQTFKGIFFHHLATFCEPLPEGWDGPVFHRADRALAALHRRSCQEYVPWVAHNAKAALGTRDESGKFGMWWTAGLFQEHAMSSFANENTKKEGTDYRNLGVPRDEVWRLPGDAGSVLPGIADPPSSMGEAADPNSRGRGRTVETQSGGVALLKALYRLTSVPEL